MLNGDYFVFPLFYEGQIKTNSFLIRNDLQFLFRFSYQNKSLLYLCGSNVIEDTEMITYPPWYKEVLDAGAHPQFAHRRIQDLFADMKDTGRRTYETL